MTDEPKKKVFENEKLLSFLRKLDDYKKRMLKGKVHEAKTICPMCGGTLILQLRGSKNHLWSACRDCTFRMIE